MQADAHAQRPRDTAAASVEYLGGEFLQGFAWSGVGLVSIGTGIVLVTRDDEVAKGASYPVLGVGAIQLGAGIVSFISPPRRAARNAVLIAADHDGFLRDEGKRIRRVNTAFRVLAITELALVVGGVATAVIGHAKDAPTAEGVGIGLASEAAVMYVLDHFAHRRAERYAARLSARADTTGFVVGLSGVL